jgi:hypothetical protein
MDAPAAHGHISIASAYVSVICPKYHLHAGETFGLPSADELLIERLSTSNQRGKTEKQHGEDTN